MPSTRVICTDPNCPEAAEYHAHKVTPEPTRHYRAYAEPGKGRLAPNYYPPRRSHPFLGYRSVSRWIFVPWAVFWVFLVGGFWPLLVWPGTTGDIVTAVWDFFLLTTCILCILRIRKVAHDRAHHE